MEMNDVSGFKSAETVFGKVSYIDIGPPEGEVILFSSGGGAGLDLVYAFDWLVQEGFRLISINRPGYFDLEVDVVDSIEGHADIYHEVIKYLGIKEVNVFGVSMGGLSALYYAQKYPTKSLVLWSAVTGEYQVSKEATDSLFGKLVMSNYGKRILSLLLLASAKIFPKLTIQALLETEADLKKKKIEEIAKQVVKNPERKREFILFIESITPMDSLYQGMMSEVEKTKQLPAVNWENISSPVLAVYSTVDKDVSIDHAQRLDEMIPDLKLIYVEAGGHFVWWGEEGEKVIKKTINFFKQHNP